jgi:hypothetical protein
MATGLTENSIAGDNIIFDDLIGKAYRNAKNADPIELLRRMVNDGVIQMDALFEKAISMVGKHTRDSAMGRDFADGSDAKKAITRWSYDSRCPNAKMRRVAMIQKIKNKKGLLRIIVAETLTNEVYYFKVPYDAYKDMTAFYIYFNEDGTPKYNGKSWQYQCKNFTEMSL